MDNKKILELANEAIAEGNHEAFLRFCTDDTQWTFVEDQTLYGKDAVRQYMKVAYKEPPLFNVEQMIAEDDFVTAIGMITMKDDNGQMTDYHYCDVWQFKAGKMSALKAFVIKKQEI